MAGGSGTARCDTVDRSWQSLIQMNTDVSRQRGWRARRIECEREREKGVGRGGGGGRQAGRQAGRLGEREGGRERERARGRERRERERLFATDSASTSRGLGRPEDRLLYSSKKQGPPQEHARDLCILVPVLGPGPVRTPHLAITSCVLALLLHLFRPRQRRH